MDFRSIKDKIALKLVNRTVNGYLLNEIPHTDFLDLTFVYFIVVNKNETDMDTIIIKNEYLDDWGITKEELHEIAYSNFTPMFSMCLYGTQSRDRFFMITTKCKLFGAVYMTEDSLLKCIADAFEDDLCIIPSSIHEIMLVPCSGLVRKEVDDVIKKVNKEAVEEDEYLSDHMYTFSRKLGKVCI